MLQLIANLTHCNLFSAGRSNTPPPDTVCLHAPKTTRQQLGSTSYVSALIETSVWQRYTRSIQLRGRMRLRKNWRPHYDIGCRAASQVRVKSTSQKKSTTPSDGAKDKCSPPKHNTFPSLWSRFTAFKTSCRVLKWRDQCCGNVHYTDFIKTTDKHEASAEFVSSENLSRKQEICSDFF